LFDRVYTSSSAPQTPIPTIKLATTRNKYFQSKKILGSKNCKPAVKHIKEGGGVGPRERGRGGRATMTMDLLCALLLFVGNVGHLGVLSYKVLKFSELEVGSQPLSCTVRTRPCVQCVADDETLSDSEFWLQSAARSAPSRALPPPLTPPCAPVPLR